MVLESLKRRFTNPAPIEIDPKRKKDPLVVRLREMQRSFPTALAVCMVWALEDGTRWKQVKEMARQDPDAFDKLIARLEADDPPSSPTAEQDAPTETVGLEGVETTETETTPETETEPTPDTPETETETAYIPYKRHRSLEY